MTDSSLLGSAHGVSTKQSPDCNFITDSGLPATESLLNDKRSIEQAEQLGQSSELAQVRGMRQKIEKQAMSPLRTCLDEEILKIESTKKKKATAEPNAHQKAQHDNHAKGTRANIGKGR